MCKLPIENKKAGYLYYDSDLEKNSIEDMAYYDSIKAPKTPLENTFNHFQSLKTDVDEILYIMFSDQKPDSKSCDNDLAHMKGTFAFHRNQGIVINLSAPRYNKNGGHYYPQSALRNAQHFFCYTIGNKALQIFARHIYITHPHIYAIHIADKFLDPKSKWLKSINDGDFEQKAVVKDDLYLTTVGGLEVNIMSKSREANDVNLWKTVVRKYNREFNVTSWWSIDDVSKTNKIHNVQDTIVRLNGKNVVWSHGRDHSKYGISKVGNAKESIFCFSDLNHTGRQIRRSGGMYCTNIPIFWKAFHKTFIFQTLDQD